MSKACAEWRGELGAYIVGALSGGASVQVKRHLEACAACRAEYQDLVPVRDWLDRLAAADGTPAERPAGPPPGPLRERHGPRRRSLAAAVTGAAAVVAAAAVALVTWVSARPAAPAFGAFDRATGIGGQARLHGIPTGSAIDLSVTGLPSHEHCTLIAVSRAGTDVAGSWNASYDGTARIAGTSAIPASRLTELRIESPARRLLLSIPVRPAPQH
jgi:hypothetical protein